MIVLDTKILNVVSAYVLKRDSVEAIKAKEFLDLLNELVQDIPNSECNLFIYFMVQECDLIIGDFNGQVDKEGDC